MAEAPKNTPEQLGEKLPINIQKAVIKSFGKLFDDPILVAKVQDKINELPEYTDRQSLSGVLNRLTWLNTDANRITEQTHDRLEYLMASLDPKKIQPYNNPSTTA